MTDEDVPIRADVYRVIAEVLDAETDLDRATDMIADRLAVLAITGDQLVRSSRARPITARSRSATRDQRREALARHSVMVMTFVSSAQRATVDRTARYSNASCSDQPGSTECATTLRIPAYAPMAR